MPATATIRVDQEVRDQLARAAQQQGISVASLLRRYAREQMIESERAAGALAEEDPATRVEHDDWDTTVGDGIA
jgi:hypothetical protein